MNAYADRFFGASVEAVDPLLDTLIRLEEERQKRRIILIPSESYVPQPVRQALGSVFTNVYAEGYPPSQMVGDDEDLLADLAQQLAYYRRYADRRFYKGADYVHFVETLAQRRAAACFANERAAAEDIWVNVQPLSGAAANLAVYDALMEPGDTLMGMDLFQGGHLTHGSEYNISGKRYRVVSYGVSSRDERLDYDQIFDLARSCRPKVIVTGYTSYPWAPDMDKFREIADAVGARLMADIAHPAGMVIAGCYPNPVGVADVVTFTTHKTLCGPRGACILTTDRALAAKIDQAVFPGIQGGPHINKFAAMCVAFEIARSDAFHDLQRRIVENARSLARGLTGRGLGLAYGGTDTHLLLLDLKSVWPKGRQAAQHPLYGEVVARILELAGIVVNKNTIPGDESTALATGIRMGTPWVTQRGMGAAEMDRLADCIAQIVRGVTGFTYDGLRGPLPRGKIDLDLLEEVQHVVNEMTCAAQAEIEPDPSGYPHYCLRPREVQQATPLFAAQVPEEADLLLQETTLIDLSDMGVVRVSGWRALPFLDDVCTKDVTSLEVGQGTRSLILDGHGRVVDDISVWRLPRDERQRDSYWLLIHPENTDRAVSWMRGLSDGYILFDTEDVWRKVRGPVKVEVLSDGDRSERMAALAVHGPEARANLSQILGVALTAETGVYPAFEWREVAYAGCGLYVAGDRYHPQSEQYIILGPQHGLQALWQALSAAGGWAVRAPQARLALRRAAGLPPCWGEGTGEREVASWAALGPLLDVTKPYFVGQDKLPSPQAPVDKPVFCWTEPADVSPKRTSLFAEHEALGAKMVPFAGWEMPVWYSSVGEEHQAVRERAGLFDVAHMGTIEVCGARAVDFLDAVSVNYVRWIADGESQYSALLDVQGQILDDIIVYRRAWDRFLVVVNAANMEKDWAWLTAIRDGSVAIDARRPWVDLPYPVTLRDLHDANSGAQQLVDLALQGPNSLQILLACVGDGALCSELPRLPRTQFVEGVLGGADKERPIDVLISRTGYTGEAVGFELYVHPDQAVALWRMLLDRGAPLGIVPCGLAARDSTRIEAGLPLYGHELGGPLGITQNEAGFGGYVKYHKPFFVGRAPYRAYHEQSQRRIARFQVVERGARALRGGEHGEPVVNRRGKVVGTVTSCALVGDRQIGMVLVDDRYAEPGTELLIYPETRRVVSKPPQEFELGDTVALPVRAEVLTRFLTRRE